MSEKMMYTALGLEPGVPSMEIKKAYRNLSLKLHPDMSGNPNTALRFSIVTKAYKCLSVNDYKKDNRKISLEIKNEDIFSLGRTLISSNNYIERKNAARKLGLTGKRSVWFFLRRGLEDTNEEVVVSCVKAAAVLGLSQGSGEIASVYEKACDNLKNSILEIAKVTKDNIFITTLEVAKFDKDKKRQSLAKHLLESK